MGVLADGTAFLSMRGLAKLCGIAVSTLSENCKAWLEGNRSGRFGQFVQRNGVGDASLYMRQEIAGSVVYVFSDQISTLFLEYYSFEAPNPTAQANYRTVARAGLKLFIYTALGYDPSRLVPPAWRHFHDRVSLASAPANYFSVFKETSEFVVNAIRAGLHVDEHTVPDISVGKFWSAYWEEVRRWWRTRTEVWIRNSMVSCDHSVFDDYVHSPWFRSDGTKASCRLSLRLDRIAFAMMHQPLRSLPENVVTLHQRGHYR